MIASGGQEAIDVYSKSRNHIDAVILDMIMPDINGGETLDSLRQIDPSVKVILTSGYSLNAEAEAVMARGCKAFIQKPFNVHSLSQILHQVLSTENGQPGV
jgi:DNA-binding NtrC family response regulator